MIQRAVLLLSLTLSLAWSPCTAQGQSAGFARDTTFLMTADFSGPGTIDTVTVRVTGDRFGNPLVWSVSVREAKGDPVYYYTECVCDADSYFESEEYILQRTYRGTKRDWYYLDLPASLIVRRRFSPGSPMFDSTRSDSFYHVFQKQLEGKFRVSAPTAQELTRSTGLKMMNNEVTLLTIPKNPSDPGESMIYVKEVRQFVPIGRW